MAWQALIGPILGTVNKIIDGLSASSADKAKMKAEVTSAIIDQSNKELEGQIQAVMAEATGESWLQRNWRPITMLTFVTLIVARWLGYVDLTTEETQWGYRIMEIGIGGYILGRSGEKIAKNWKAS